MLGLGVELLHHRLDDIAIHLDELRGVLLVGERAVLRQQSVAAGDDLSFSMAGEEDLRHRLDHQPRARLVANPLEVPFALGKPGARHPQPHGARFAVKPALVEQPVDRSDRRLVEVKYWES